MKDLVGLKDKHLSKLRNVEGIVVSIDSAGRIDIFEVIENS